MLQPITKNHSTINAQHYAVVIPKELPYAEETLDFFLRLHELQPDLHCIALTTDSETAEAIEDHYQNVTSHLYDPETDFTSELSALDRVYRLQFILCPSSQRAPKLPFTTTIEIPASETPISFQHRVQLTHIKPSK